MSAADHWVSPEFPGIRWGFTTMNFLPHVEVTPESSIEHIDFARSLGLTWIELRDPDAALTPDECRKIAAHARKSGIQVNYSAQRGLLASDFWEVFKRAATNTGIFDGPKTIRVLALRESHERGWNDAEFEKMVEIANEGALRAAEVGLRFAVENADGALEGREQGYHGMIEFFAATNSDVLLQLDTANLFTGAVATHPEDATEFIRDMADRIAYVHLKSARNGKALSKIEGNPLGFREILTILSRGNRVPPVALEFAPGPDVNSVRRNT